MRKSTQTVKTSQATAVAGKLTKDDAKRKTKLKPYKASRKAKSANDDTEDEDEGDVFAISKNVELGNDFFYDDDEDDDFYFDDNPFYN